MEEKEQSFREFVNEIHHRDVPRNMAITNSFSAYDCYRAIRKHKWFDIGRPVEKHVFFAIIRGINTRLAENLKRGESIAFPYKMGKLELRKFQNKVSFVDGKLKIPYPINWDATLKLWYKDKEAREKKTFIYTDRKWGYKIKYRIDDSNYNNMTFYQFAVSRAILKALRENIKQGKIETLWGS